MNNTVYKPVPCSEIVLTIILIAVILWSIVTVQEHGVLIFSVCAFLLIIVRVTR